MYKKEATLSKSLTYGILGFYLGITILSYIVIHFMLHIDYGTEQFVLYKFPFLLVNATMMILFVKHFNKTLSFSTFLSKKWSFYFINLIPIGLIVAFFLVTKFTFNSFFWIPLLSTLLVGIGEELLFRKVIFTFFLQNTSFYKALIFSSLLFGASHGIVLLSGSDLKHVLLQIVLATLMGVYYGLMYLYTRKIESVILDHALWDYMLIGGVLKNYPLIALIVPVLLMIRLVTIGIMLINYKKEMQKR